MNFVVVAAVVIILQIQVQQLVMIVLRALLDQIPVDSSVGMNVK